MAPPLLLEECRVDDRRGDPVTLRGKCQARGTKIVMLNLMSPCEPEIFRVAARNEMVCPIDKLPAVGRNRHVRIMTNWITFRDKRKLHMPVYLVARPCGV